MRRYSGDRERQAGRKLSAVLTEPWREYAHGSEIDHFADFCRRFLVQSNDRWAGQPLELEWFQRRMMGEALAFDELGLPIWRRIAIVMPRKNGKTLLLAGYALYRLVTSDGSPEILFAASSDKQAGRLFDSAAKFVRRSPELLELLRVRDHIGEIVREDGMGVIYRLSSDPGKLHGYDPSEVVVDELAQFTTPSLRRGFAALTSGGGARSAPQVFAISTAGEAHEREESILGRIIDGAVAKGEVESEPGLTIARVKSSKTLLYNHEAPTTNPHDIASMKLANPASWITEKFLAEQAADDELTDAQVLQLHGCVWAAGVDAWITPEAWGACYDPKAIIPEGSPVVAAVDVGIVHDATAVAVAWKGEDGRVIVEAHTWGPAGSDSDELTGGRMSLSVVEEYIRDLNTRFVVTEVVYDPRYFERSAEILSEEGFVMAELVQSSSAMLDAYQAWYAAVVEQRVAHAGAKGLTAHVLATAAEKTDRGWKVRKMRQSRRIDAHIAVVMAHFRAEMVESDPFLFEVWN